jgi:hypothetical protein
MSAIATFWSHSDIVTLQTTLGADLEATNTGVQACTGLDATTLQEWNFFYAGANAFVHEDANWLATGTQADEGQEYQRQLIAWRQKLSVKCPNLAPVSSPGGGKQIDTGMTTALKYGAVIAGFLGTAYVVAKVSEFIPRPSPRKST